MKKSVKNIALLGSALCFMSFLAVTYSAGVSHFAVTGQVFCDTCRVQFITRLSWYIQGSLVKLECRDREVPGALTFSAEGMTDPSGSYHIQVDGDHEDDVCQIVLVKSGSDNCTEISNDDKLKKAARVSLTNNNGVVSNWSIANPLGFMPKDPYPECTDALKSLGITPEGIVPS